MSLSDTRPGAPVVGQPQGTSASYHPYTCPLVITPYIHIYIWVRGDTQRTPRDTLLDPKLAVESISEVPGASKAHRDVVNRAVP